MTISLNREVVEQAEKALTRAVLALAHAINSRPVSAYGADYEACDVALRSLRAALAVESAAPPVRSEPVAWQWRRKGEPWTVDKTFTSEVFATTADSEVRALYLAPPAPASSDSLHTVQALEKIVAYIHRYGDAHIAKVAILALIEQMQRTPAPPAASRDLTKAAQAVLERWDNPKWDWLKQGPTADLMADLRRALEASRGESQ